MIDTQAIRSKILDLAIRGKLTEQLPEDGTAEELYRQIQEEKHTLAKEGKIRKEKPLPAITETPYDIPDAWAWVRWGELSFQIQYGYNAPAQRIGRIRMVRITDIQNNQVIWNTVPYCNIDENCIDEYRLKPNNILFARTGGTVGKSYLVEKVEEDAVFAGYLIRSSFSSKLNAKYMKYFMESRLYWKQLQDGTTATAQPNCNAKTLSKMMVPLPPLAEQNRIVERIEQAFSALDTIDTLQTQYADNLTILKSKLIDSAIQGKLTEQLPEDGTAEEYLRCLREQKKAIENSGVLKGRKKKAILPLDDVACPFTIPATWKWIRLDSVAEIFGRIGFRGYTKNDIVEQGKGAISLSPSNIAVDGKCTYEKCTFISWEKYDESPEIMVNEEDVIIVKTGSSYGKCGVVRELPEKATINPQLALLKYILCNRYYLHIVLNSTMARKQYEDFVVGAATPTFSQEDLSNFILPLPPPAEQKRIVERVTGLLAVCDELKCDKPHFKGESSYE